MGLTVWQFIFPQKCVSGPITEDIPQSTILKDPRFLPGPHCSDCDVSPAIYSGSLLSVLFHTGLYWITASPERQISTLFPPFFLLKAQWILPLSERLIAFILLFSPTLLLSASFSLAENEVHFAAKSGGQPFKVLSDTNPLSRSWSHAAAIPLDVFQTY